MEWGVELWGKTLAKTRYLMKDQFENVDKHHHHGIEYARKYAKFVKERYSLEMEYASKLKKLAKAYQPKKKDEDRSMFSTHKAFQSQLSELVDIAGQHEVIAEEIIANINKSLLLLCNELEIEKKKIFLEGRHQQTELEQQEKSMEHTKRKFEKEWKECERAQAYFEKLDKDINVTKIDVEKARNAWIAKKDSVEACKTDYASALQNFNKFQENHYTVNMPKLFKTFKDADEKRIVKSGEFMMEFSRIEMKVQPLIQKCLEGMEKAAGAVDAKLDSQIVIDKLKSGFPIPSDKEFEDFTQQQMQRHSTTDGFDRSVPNSNRQSSKKGLSWLFGNKKLSKDVQEGHVQSTPRSSSFSGLSSDVSDDSTNATFPKDVTPQQKSRTLTIGTAKSYSTEITSSKTSDKTRSENKSSSCENLSKNDDKSDANTQKKKSFKTITKHLDIRKSMPVNKKLIKSMFRSNKDDHTPKIEVSGPITCDLINPTLNDDYLVPITPQSEQSKIQNENPYDEVSDQLGDDVSSVMSVIAESPDYSHLPPEQRRKKLQKLIDDLNKDLSKEKEGRKAILKMQDVYRSNPAMGDADTVARQLSVATAKIEKIQAEISKLESWYSSAGGKSGSNQHLSKSATPQPSHSIKTRPLPAQPSENNESSKHHVRDQSFGDDFDEEPEPIGTCVALYDFDATSEGALSMKSGEKFSVIEADNGDGWTRALRGDVDGYVPTSYVEIDFYT